MALIRSATRRDDWVVALRIGTGGAVLTATLIGGLRPLLLVAAVTALVLLEAVFELRGAPARPVRERVEVGPVGIMRTSSSFGVNR